VLAEISAKVPPEEWAKLDKTHYADPDTLATLNRLERENADLRANLEEARKDAERYRWLREPQEHVCVEVEAENEDGYTNTFYSTIREELDAAIDAAIAQGKEEK
jgi:hypothetical protein